MLIKSFERTTGMGAHHATQVETVDGWYAVSEFPEATYLKREDGFAIWEMEIDPGNDHYRAYHLSNSGNEVVEPGKECLGY